MVSWGFRASAVGAVAAGLVFCAVDPASAATALVVGGQHQVGSTFSFTTGPIASCPPGRPVTASTCYLVGAGAGGTAPPGVSPFPPDDYLFQIVPVHDGKPGTPVDFTGGASASLISCVSSSVCDTVGYSTSYAKAAFIPILKGKPGKPIAVKGTLSWSGLVCTSPGNCVASGRVSNSSGTVDHGIVVRLHDGKAGSPQVLSGTEDTGGLSCLSKTSCVVTGNTTNFKHGFYADVTSGHAGKVHVIKKVSGLNSVTCGWAKKTCIAAGEQSTRTSGILPAKVLIHGSKLTITRGSTAKPVLGFACRAVANCLGFGVVNPNSRGQHGVVALARKGRIGTAKRVNGSGYVQWVTCPEAGSCLGIATAAKGTYPGDTIRTFTIRW